MILYPGIITIKEPIPFERLGEYRSIYESEFEIPPDSFKPKRIETAGIYSWSFEFYAGYKKFIIPFPSWQLFNAYIDVIDDSFFGGSAEFRLLKDVFDSLQRYGVPSLDYTCRSNSACGNRKYIDKDAVTSKIIEWLGNERYHFMTIEQFCNIDFNNYFDSVSHDDPHYIENITYLRNLIFQNKDDRRDKKGRSMSDIVIKHQREKVEYLLRTNPIGFAIDHFRKYIKSPKSSNYKHY